MKKAITSLVLVGALGIGGILTYSMSGDQGEPKQESSENVQAASNEVKEVVEVRAPTERTVDTNGDAPWKYMSSEQTKQAQDQGEVVYLFEDAEGIENQVQSLAKTENTEPYSKEDLAEGWAEEISVFIEGVSSYFPDKQPYFAKLKEVQNALATHDYESVDKLVEEAKTLR